MANLNPDRKRTHVVIDNMYFGDEARVYSGSEQDCRDFIAEQAECDPVGSCTYSISLNEYYKG